MRWIRIGRELEKGEILRVNAPDDPQDGDFENTKMTKTGKPTNEHVFVPLDHHYDEEIAAHQQLLAPGSSRNYEKTAAFGALETIDSKDSRQDDQELLKSISSMA